MMNEEQRNLCRAEQDAILSVLDKALGYLTKTSSDKRDYFSAKRILHAVDSVGENLPRKITLDEVDFMMGGDNVSMVIAQLDINPPREVRLYRKV